MIKPELEFVYEAGGDLGQPREIGATHDGTRRIIPILEGGYVKGPKISGKLLGTDDGALIQLRNRGLRHGPGEVMDRLRRGEDVDPADYYFRTVPEFIAPDGPYDWLNKSVFVCSGARYAASIKLWVWRVL
jgi:Protein of unknown function (DUF3237)